MSVELQKFDFKNPNAWALISKFRSDWVRQVASKYEIDVPRFMLGCLLGTIVGDDSNCFGLYCAPFDAKIAKIGKEYLIIRMGWEIDLPETPVEIRRKLEDLLPEVMERDWGKEEDFITIRNKWHTGIRNFVEEEISREKEYEEAIRYSCECNETLNEEYSELLFGDK
ncbi:MAG: hypothetical protein PHE21_01520 [Candidatus Dojkabacteria bacterium]|nr:hypothetical protein [Candidatus Dojkabacteria bacterium]